MIFSVLTSEDQKSSLVNLYCIFTRLTYTGLKTSVKKLSRTFTTSSLICLGSLLIKSISLACLSIRIFSSLMLYWFAMVVASGPALAGMSAKLSQGRVRIKEIWCPCKQAAKQIECMSSCLWSSRCWSEDTPGMLEDSCTRLASILYNGSLSFTASHTCFLSQPPYFTLCYT